MSTDLLAELRRRSPAAAPGRRGSSRGRSSAQDRPRASSTGRSPIARCRGLPPLDGLVVAVHSPRAGHAAGRAGRKIARSNRDRRDQRCRGRRPCGDGWERVRGRRRAQRHEPAGPRRQRCVTHRRRDDRKPIPPRHLRWTARFAWGLLLLLAGAALATWGLSRWEAGARFLGVAPRQPLQVVRQAAATRRRCAASRDEPLAAADAARIAAHRIPAGARSRARPRPPPGRPAAPMPCWSPSPPAGRSIAASRSAISSPCWSSASAPQHQAAVATIVTASRDPVRLDSLIAEYEALGTGASRRRARRRLVGRLPARARLDRLDPPRRHAVAAAAGALRPGAGAARGRRSRCGAGRDDAPAGRRQRRPVDRARPAATSPPTARSTKSNPRPCSASRQRQFLPRPAPKGLGKRLHDLRSLRVQALVQQRWTKALAKLSKFEGAVDAMTSLS